MKLSGFFKKTDIEDSNAGCSTSNSASDRTKLIQNAPKRKAANRKYNPEYIAFGFTFIEEFGIQLPQCVICAEVLSNEAMKPAKLTRHFETKHKDFAGKHVDVFKRKEAELKTSKNILKSYSTHDKATLKASYQLSLRIAKTKTSFTVGEELVLPCIVDATQVILGDKYAKKMLNIPLSNDTVSRRIEAMASDVETQLIIKIHTSIIFAVQLDESTDNTNKAILLVYVRYIDKDNKRLSEEFLTSIMLQGHTTGKDIFKAIDDYFKLRNLSWKDCVGLCTDGAAAMTGHKTGLPSLVRKEANSDIVLTHCIIHREMLAAKSLTPDLNVVLTTVVKAVNFIRSNALNSRLFALLCEDMGSIHSSLLLHTEVRWLSRGRVLARFYELREEVCMFLDEKNPDLSKILRDSEFMAKLAFLADIFEQLNIMNLGLQGPSKTAFDLWKKIESFKKKLLLWKSENGKGSFEMFHLFSDFMSENEGLNKENLHTLVKSYITALEGYFEKYFPAHTDVRKNNLWVIDPFLACNGNNLSIREQEQLIEISSDAHLKAIKSQSENIADFWVGLIDESPLLSEKALKLLLPFHSTYLCETAFSTLSVIKNKHRNRLLNLNAPMRLALTSFEPNIEKLSSEMQDQGSH